MRNPLRRKRPRPRPALRKLPAQWITLLATVKDPGEFPNTGEWQNCIDHFETQEDAAAFLEAAPDHYLEGFKGAYREIPDFLAGVRVRTKLKSRAEGVSAHPPAAAPTQEDPDELDITPFHLSDESIAAELDQQGAQVNPEACFPEFVVLTKGDPAGPPSFHAGYRKDPGAIAHKNALGDSGKLAAAYRRV